MFTRSSPSANTCRAGRGWGGMQQAHRTRRLPCPAAANWRGARASQTSACPALSAAPAADLPLAACQPPPPSLPQPLPHARKHTAHNTHDHAACRWGSSPPRLTSMANLADISWMHCLANGVSLSCSAQGATGSTWLNQQAASGCLRCRHVRQRLPRPGASLCRGAAPAAGCAPSPPHHHTYQRVVPARPTTCPSCLLAPATRGWSAAPFRPACVPPPL